MIIREVGGAVYELEEYDGMTYPRKIAPTCQYCAGQAWRTNLRGKVECSGCSAPVPEQTIDELAVQYRAVGYPVFTFGKSDWEDTFDGQLEKMNEQVTEAKRTIGEQLLPVLMPLVEWGAKLVARA